MSNKRPRMVPTIRLTGTQPRAVPQAKPVLPKLKLFPVIKLTGAKDDQSDRLQQ